jgi:hypothetical protein
MKKFEWQEGLKEKIDALCAIFPPVIKDRWINRLIYNTEKLASYEGLTAVTNDVFWRSVTEVFPGGFEPLILKVKDPEKLKAAMLSSKEQESMEHGKEPVTITRWSQAAGRNSSARKGGNTDIIVDELVRSCKDNGTTVEKLYLSDLNIKQCTGCRACRKGDVKTICALRDDMIPFYDKLYEADGFIAGFPIYTARENGIMATFMDRWDCFSNPYLTRKMPEGKKGLIVCSWMWPNATAYDDVVEKMVILFRLHHILTTDVLAVTGTRGKKHGKGVVQHHPAILNTAYETGVDFLKGL